jgi:hypothetical protein
VEIWDNVRDFAWITVGEEWEKMCIVVFAALTETLYNRGSNHHTVLEDAHE